MIFEIYPDSQIATTEAHKVLLHPFGEIPYMWCSCGLYLGSRGDLGNIITPPTWLFQLSLALGTGPGYL